MQVKLRKRGRYVHDVTFDCEHVGRIEQLSPGRYQVWSLKDHGRDHGSSCVVASFEEAVSMFTSIHWRSVVGRSALSIPRPTFIPKLPKLTKQRWSVN